MVTPAGWYPDPNGQGLRYWDGQQWGQVRKGTPLPPWWVWLIIAVITITIGCVSIFAVAIDPSRPHYPPASQGMFGA
jgi:hypothetical protein